MYYLRTEKGDLKASLTDLAAKDIMTVCPGSFRPRGGEGTVTVYEFDQTMSWGNELFKIHIWAGDYLVPPKN